MERTPPADAIGAIADWLIGQSLGDAGMDATVRGCCERLCAAGIPLWRGHVAFPVLHPLFHAVGVTWHRDRGMTLGRFASPHMGPAVSADFRASPYYAMIQGNIPHLRRRLAGAEAVIDYPILQDLQRDGATDYAAFVIAFSPDKRDGIAGSWTTDAPAGFTDAQVAALRRLQPHLAAALKAAIKDQIARNVMTAYLGPDAGARVLSGEIRRGSGETIDAVIWYCDLRGSTDMAEALSQADFLTLLNRYFECTAGAVLAAGGNVLSFIGDAVLAIFPFDGASASDACGQALAAAADAGARLERLNGERAAGGLAPLAFGLGLHAGRVMYGNIGVPERLEFTVIGRAINEVARLETLTKSLGRSTLASGDFVARAPAASWLALGHHQLRGVGAPVEVFAPLG